MNATEITRVEIDEKIREQPELLRAVNEATHYLEEQAEEVPPPALIGWRFADADGTLLQLTLSDADDPKHIVRHDYWARWILDPVNQKLCVLRAWGALLSKRSDSRMARISRLNAQLKVEVANGGENAD